MFECEYDCGFERPVIALVEAHEKICAKNPAVIKAKAAPAQAKRFRFTVAQQRQLQQSLESNRNPEELAMSTIARSMDCETFRIKNWFSNQRKKEGTPAAPLPPGVAAAASMASPTAAAALPSPKSPGLSAASSTATEVGVLSAVVQSSLPGGTAPGPSSIASIMGVSVPPILPAAAAAAAAAPVLEGATRKRSREEEEAADGARSMASSASPGTPAVDPSLGGSDVSKKPKQFRFKAAQKRELEAAFLTNAHPDEIAVARIAGSFFCEEFRISNWFKNKRKQNNSGDPPAPATTAVGAKGAFAAGFPRAALLARSLPAPVQQPMPGSRVGSSSSSAGLSGGGLVAMRLMESGLQAPLLANSNTSAAAAAAAAMPPTLSGGGSSAGSSYASAPRLPGTAMSLPRPAPAPPPGFQAQMGPPSQPIAMEFTAAPSSTSAAAARRPSLVPTGPNPYTDVLAGVVPGSDGAKKTAPPKKLCKSTDSDGVGCTTFARIQGLCAKHYKMKPSTGTTGRAAGADGSFVPWGGAFTEPRRTYNAGGSTVWLHARKAKWRAAVVRRREKQSDWQKVTEKIEQRKLSPEEHDTEMEKAKRRFSAEETRKLDAFYFRKNNPSKEDVVDFAQQLAVTEKRIRNWLERKRKKAAAASGAGPGAGARASGTAGAAGSGSVLGGDGKSKHAGPKKHTFDHLQMMRPRKDQALSVWVTDAKKRWFSARKERKSKKRKAGSSGGAASSGHGPYGSGTSGNGRKRPKRSRKELLWDIKQLKAENLALAQYIVASRAKFGVAFPD